MKFFRATTLSKVIIMGRNTLASLPGGKPLSGRTTILLSSHSEEMQGVILCRDIETLFEVVKKYDSDNVFVVGGQSVYEQLLPYCEKAYITKIDCSAEADCYFPNLDINKDWKKVFQSERKLFDGIGFSFNTYVNSGKGKCIK